tara:strand:- start:7287 stop:8216 length:930 start_codon:yes stop_codon:yes gene_type:complete
MKQILKEWRQFLQESSKAEAKYFGKAFQKLLADPSLIEDDDWIEQNIGPKLGSGAFRRVYHIRKHPDKIFKVARLFQQEYTMHMNWQEKETFNKAPLWFPKVFLTAEEKIQSLDPVAFRNVDSRDVAGLAWIVVEKVEVVSDDEEYDLLLADNFPSLEKAVVLLKTFILSNSFRKMSGVEEQLDRVISPRKLFDIIIKPHLGKDEEAFRSLTTEDPPSKNEIEELVFQFLPFQPSTIIFKQFREAATKAWTMLSSGRLAYVKEMLNELGIADRWDIRPDNVGKRGKQMLFIDIFKEPGKKAPTHGRLEQ